MGRRVVLDVCSEAASSGDLSRAVISVEAPLPSELLDALLFGFVQKRVLGFKVPFLGLAE